MDEFRVIVFDTKHYKRTLDCMYFSDEKSAYDYAYNMFEFGYNVFVVKNYDDVVLSLTNHSF